jgi:hypothetical protein
MVFTRSENVPDFGDYILYRDQYLRPDFHYRCAYCLIHERLFLETGGGEIDHHRPLNPPRHVGKDFSHLRSVYSNLYWTCGACNGAKGNTWPSDEEYEANERFLDPCQEDHLDHWDVNDDGVLLAKTAIGQYTITEVRLNRAFLIRIRRRFLDRQRQAAELKQMLPHSDLSPEQRAKIDKFLADDLLLNPMAFEL